MKNNKGILVLLCLSSVFCSCEKEYETHCDSGGPLGQVCKELRYEEGVLVEAVSYEYGNNDKVSLKLHENKGGRNIGQVLYEYDTRNNLTSEIYKDSDKEVLITNSWTYNDNQQVMISKTNTYSSRKELHFFYDGEVLAQEKLYIDDNLKNNKTYSYFENDTMSFDVKSYDVDSVLLNVNQVRRFDTFTLRAERYDASGDLLSYEVILYNEQSKLIEKRTYDVNLSLVDKEQYVYENGMVKEYRLLSSIKPNKKVMYLRFD